MRKRLILAAVTMGLTLPAVPAVAAARAIEVNDVVQVRQIPETRISPDGSRVAFVVNEPSVAENRVTSKLMLADFAAPDRARQVFAGDRVTDVGWMPDGSLSFVSALDGADEIWSVPATGGKPRKLFASPAAAVPIGGQRLAFYDAYTPPHSSKVLRHQWSADGRLAFVTPHLVVPDATEGVVYDETKLGVQSIVEGQYGSARAGVWTFDPGTRRPRHLIGLDLGAQGRLGPTLAWSADDGRLELTFSRQSWVVDARTGALVDVPPSTPTPPPVSNAADNFSAWSYAGQRAAAVKQNASSPPRLVVADGQAVRDGYNPNTWFKDVRFIPPVAAQWTDEHGHKAGGYQIIPPSCQARRCPAIVITHGYDAAANRFMWDGHEWQYPSQVFAAKGYVVLGVDESGDAPTGPGRDWPETLRTMLEPVSIMEAAVRAGIAAGHIDPARVGIAGYSRGAEVAQLAIAHSATFKAASSGEGGNGTVGYWLFGAQNPFAADQGRQVFGGSPVDPSARGRWQDYAADLRAGSVTAPLLIQAAESNSIANMELRAYLKARGTPVDLVIYPNETHIFHQPAHRVAAMTQNLAWFGRWLGPGDVRAGQRSRLSE